MKVKMLSPYNKCHTQSIPCVAICFTMVNYSIRVGSYPLHADKCSCKRLSASAQYELLNIGNPNRRQITLFHFHTVLTPLNNYCRIMTSIMLCLGNTGYIGDRHFIQDQGITNTTAITERENGQDICRIGIRMGKQHEEV